MAVINRHSRLPLYFQLYESLRGEILSGDRAPGEVLPPESDLCETHHISRTTVRQVLDMLAKEGLIVRQPGRGTFVAEPSLEQGLVRIVSFTDDMRQRGLIPSTQTLATGLVAAPPGVAEKLQVQPGEELAFFRRLRLADGIPMSVEESYFVHRLCPGLLEQDLSARPLHEILAEVYDLKWSRARQRIRAQAATPEQARVLGIAPGSALLHVERVSYSQSDTPAEYLRIEYRGDRYTLYNELQG